MKNDLSHPIFDEENMHHLVFPELKNKIPLANSSNKKPQNLCSDQLNNPTDVLFITSYPPRECGIATYSQDLIKALNHKFSNSFSIKVCALESGNTNYSYPEEVKYVLNTTNPSEYEKLALQINNEHRIKIVLIQHEFGFFHDQKLAFLKFLSKLKKPVVIVFHTVLPSPDEKLKFQVQCITAMCKSIIVMTNTSADILKNEYSISPQKISVIAHGTHLVPHLSEKTLKAKYGLTDRKVLTTFGLLSSGKSIETTIDALPAIVKQCPEITFLVIGKTHPEVVKNEGEKYREMLEKRVEQLDIKEHVRFINNYLNLPELLEYLQLTDIYLFTTNDPNQAVSGTFAYAMSCACPIISTPIPHAKEVLSEDTGIIFDFRNSEQLADSILHLLNDDQLRINLSTNSLQKIVSSAWENSVVLHAMLFSEITGNKTPLQYNLPGIKLDHIKQMTTDVGIIQFSKINQPDLSTGYTLDDNARAMIAMCMYYQSSGNKEVLTYIQRYLDFIQYCQQPEGNFSNYVDENKKFTSQNLDVNLDDSNGRAIWALGYLISLKELMPKEIVQKAKTIFKRSLPNVEKMHSTRAMAFSIKGIYFYQTAQNTTENIRLVKVLANRLVQMYKHESAEKWNWFEGYLTYANSILPEALLYAWLLTSDLVFKNIALSTMDFLLSQIFNKNGIEVISNKHWLQRGHEASRFGEQPIDVAYTIMTLSKFYDEFRTEDYRVKLKTAFNWFLGENRLHQIIYNPCTGGCYDGLEENNINLNQGAESTVSYLMARLTIEKYMDTSNKQGIGLLQNHNKLHIKNVINEITN